MGYQTLLLLHVGPLLGALALSIGSELLLTFARGGAMGPARVALTAGGIADVLVIIGALAGVGLVVLGGWPLLTPWLVASFVMIVLLILIGRKFVNPWAGRAKAALRDGASSEVVSAMARNGVALGGRIAVIGLFFVIVALMTFKPDLPL